MKLSMKHEIVPIGILVVLLILSFYFYPGLPDKVASHFNMSGTPDGYSPKLQFMMIFWGICIGMYLILTFIPLIDPFWKKIESRYGTLLLLRDFAMLFMVFIFVVSIIGAKRGTLPVQVMNIGLGFLFIFLGNWLPKLPRNFFFGIRTPWTLASEEVWKKSHILGGWLFVAGGILLIIFAIIGISPMISLIAILAPIVLISAIIYPLFLYRKLQKENRLEGPEL
jgi:uncharacterized membrane protein